MMHTPRQMTPFTRRRLLALAAGAVAAGTLAACGASKPPASPAPTTAPPAPTTLPSPVATVETRAINGTAQPAGGVFNVKQYGAAGDGATDDTAAIQATIDAVPASGGTVMFPPGTYIVVPTQTRGLAIKSNLRIAGAGEQSVIKIKDRAGNWQRLFSPRDLGASVENVAFEDLSFDANILNNPEATINEKNETTYQTFVHITAGNNLHVRRCRFNPYAGVWAVSFTGKTIRDCSVVDSYFRFVMRDDKADYDNSAVYVDGVNYIFSGNRFESVPQPQRGARACMEAHGGPAEVFNNTAVGFQTILNIVGQYDAGGSPGDVNCHNNTCTDALLGIMLWPTKPNDLKNVIVADNTIAIAQTKHGAVETSGVYVLFSSEAKGLAANITIARNTITFQDEGRGRAGDFYYNSAGIGLHNLGGVNGVVIEENTIENAPAAGVMIGLPEPGKRSFQNVRVLNNTIVNPGQNLAFPADYRAGILVTSSAANLTITGNTITDTFPVPRAAAAVVFDMTPKNTYSGITVRDNTAKAINGPLMTRLPNGAER